MKPAETPTVSVIWEEIVHEMFTATLSIFFLHIQLLESSYILPLNFFVLAAITHTRIFFTCALATVFEVQKLLTKYDYDVTVF